MHDDVTMGFLAGAGDSLHLILLFILGLMLLGLMGHWWFWAFIVPTGGRMSKKRGRGHPHALLTVGGRSAASLFRSNESR